VKELGKKERNWLHMQFLFTDKDRDSLTQRAETILDRILEDDLPGPYYIGMTSDVIGRWIGVKRAGPEGEHSRGTGRAGMICS